MPTNNMKRRTTTTLLTAILAALAIFASNYWDINLKSTKELIVIPDPTTPVAPQIVLRDSFIHDTVIVYRAAKTSKVAPTVALSNYAATPADSSNEVLQLFYKTDTLYLPMEAYVFTDTTYDDSGNMIAVSILIRDGAVDAWQASVEAQNKQVTPEEIDAIVSAQLDPLRDEYRRLSKKHYIGAGPLYNVDRNSLSAHLSYQYKGIAGPVIQVGRGGLESAGLMFTLKL